MHVNDIVRLFFEDQTVTHYLIVAISETAVRLRYPGGEVDLIHDNGLLSSLNDRTIVGVEVVEVPHHDEFVIGGFARVNMLAGSVRGKVISVTNGILELVVDETTIYVDLDNLPATVRSVDVVSGSVDTYDPAPEDDILDTSLQLHIVDNQLLSLYGALLSDVHEDERSAPVRRAIHKLVTRFKHLHREFTSAALEPLVPTNRMLGDAKFGLKWLFPYVKIEKNFYGDMKPFLSDIEAALTEYAARSTSHRYHQYLEKISAAWEPITRTGAATSVRVEGLAKRVRVIKRNEFSDAALFTQTYAPGDMLSTSSYVLMQEAVPYARITLPETPLYTRCLLQSVTPLYYKCIPRWLKAPVALDKFPRIGGVLETLEPLSIWAAIRSIEPYLYYKRDLSFKFQKLLNKKIRVAVSTYKASRPVQTAAPLSTPPTLAVESYALQPLFTSERLAAMTRVDALRHIFGRARRQRDLVPSDSVPSGYPACLPDDCPADDEIQAALLPEVPKLKRVKSFVPDDNLQQCLALQAKLFSKYDKQGQDAESELPPYVLERLRAYNTLTRNGLTEANAPQVLGMLQRYARPARTGEDAGWLYMRDDNLRFVPLFVETLSRAIVTGGSGGLAKILEDMTASSSVVVEDGHFLDKATGFIVGSTEPTDVDTYENGVKIVHSAIVPSDIKDVVYSVNDTPLLNILRALCDQQHVSLKEHTDYIISRVRGIETSHVIPSIAAYVILFIEQEFQYKLKKNVSDSVRKMVSTMRAQKKSPAFKYWEALEVPKLDAEISHAMELATADIGFGRLGAPRSAPVIAGYTWSTFLPVKDMAVVACEAVRTRSRNILQGKLAACATQVVILARKHLHAVMPMQTSLFQILEPVVAIRLAYLNELRILPYVGALTQLHVKMREGSFRGSLPPEITPLDVASSNHLADLLDEWDILGPSGIDLSKLGAYVQAYSNHVRGCLDAGRSPDILHDLIQAACGRSWSSIVDIRDFLVNTVRAVTATIPNQIMLGFNNFSAGRTLERTDRIIPTHAMSGVTALHVKDLLKDVEKSYAPIRSIATADAVHRVFSARARGQPEGEAVLADAAPAIQFARNYDIRKKRFMKIYEVALLARHIDDGIPVLKFCLLYAWTLLLTDANGDRLVGSAKDYACSVVRACAQTFQTDAKRLNFTAVQLDTAMRKSKLREAKQFSLRITDDDRQTRVRRVFMNDQGLTEAARLGRTFTHSKEKETLEDTMRQEFEGVVDQTTDDNWQEETELAYGEVDDGEGRMEWEDS